MARGTGILRAVEQGCVVSGLFRRQGKKDKVLIESEPRSVGCLTIIGTENFAGRGTAAAAAPIG